MEYKPHTDLGLLAKELLLDLERFRQGYVLSSSNEFSFSLKERARLRFLELMAEFYPENSPNSENETLFWREFSQVLLPRYELQAKSMNQLELANKPWSKGDWINRSSYAGILFLVGIFVVWAPFIPIWEKWIPFAASIGAFITAPFLPNLYQKWIEQRHTLQLTSLVEDLDQIGNRLPATSARILGPKAA